MESEQEVQRQIAQVWREELDLEAVEPDDDFFSSAGIRSSRCASWLAFAI